MGKEKTAIESQLSLEGFLFYRLATNQTDVAAELWSIESKVCGIAHLLQAADIEVLPSGSDLYGLGAVLRELADQLRQIRSHVECKGH